MLFSEHIIVLIIWALLVFGAFIAYCFVLEEQGKSMLDSSVFDVGDLVRYNLPLFPIDKKLTAEETIPLLGLVKSLEIKYSSTDKIPYLMVLVWFPKLQEEALLHPWDVKLVQKINTTE